MIGPFISIDAPVTRSSDALDKHHNGHTRWSCLCGEARVHCMKEKPKRRDEPILSRYMINQILFSRRLHGSPVSPRSSSLKNIFLFSPSTSNLGHLTAFFALFIFTSVFNCFNARTDRIKFLSGVSKNKGFILIMFLVMFVQILFVYLRGDVLRTTPLTSSELIFTMLLSLLVFPADIIRKILWRLRGKKNGF